MPCLEPGHPLQLSLAIPPWLGKMSTSGDYRQPTVKVSGKGKEGGMGKGREERAKVKKGK